jgi:FkbM family methyltransferase
MLIDFIYLVEKYNLNIQGILHIGAHYCEELDKYKQIVKENQIIWIEGNVKIVENIKNKFPDRRIYNFLISDKDNDLVSFIITNNGESSSILELKEHLKEHPHIHEISRENRITSTIDTFVKYHNIENTLNFVNIDIQGAELKALMGMKNYLKNVDYLYLEVNEKELYQDCCLLSELDAFLENYGFIRKEIKMTEYGWGDAFYLKSQKN